MVFVICSLFHEFHLPISQPIENFLDFLFINFRNVQARNFLDASITLIPFKKIKGTSLDR